MSGVFIFSHINTLLLNLHSRLMDTQDSRRLSSMYPVVKRATNTSYYNESTLSNLYSIIQLMNENVQHLINAITSFYTSTAQMNVITSLYTSTAQMNAITSLYTSTAQMNAITSPYTTRAQMACQV